MAMALVALQLFGSDFWKRSVFLFSKVRNQWRTEARGWCLILLDFCCKQADSSAAPQG